MHKPINIAYFSYDGLTDPLGQSQIIPYLIGLSRQGYRFRIFSFEKRERFIELKDKIACELKQSSIVWFPLLYTKWPPVLSTLLDLWKLWRLFIKENERIKFEILHCRSYVTALLGLNAKRKFGTKFIFDMRGFWADERVEGGLWNLKNPIYKIVYTFFKRKERQFLKEADQTISLTENAKQEILSWGLDGSPITIIPTCVDLALFDPKKIAIEEQVTLRRRLGIKPSDFVLLYLGSLGTWYLVDEMLYFFKVLKRHNSSAKFLIVTKDSINLKEFDFKDDVILTSSTRDLVPLHISISNLAICFIKPTYSKKASSATKVGEILAMKIPLKTNRGWGDIEYMLKNENAFCVPGEISNQDFSKKENLIMPDLSHFSLSHGISLYAAVYKKVLNQY